MLFWILLVAYLLVTAGIAPEVRGNGVGAWGWLMLLFWPLALLYRLGQKIA